MLSKEEIENNELYKSNYMQNPFEILLTEEKLDRLEKHCKKAIYFERGNIREEHEIVLTLLYKYEQLEPKANKYDSLVKEIKDKIEKLENIKEQFKDDYMTLNYLQIRISQLQELLKEVEDEL